MFGKDNQSSGGGTSVLAKDILIKGNIFSDGVTEIQGKVEGDINGNVITVREDGIVTGNISSKILNIKGKFNGIAKSEKINISKDGKVNGTLQYETLGVEDGAFIEGNLKCVVINNKINTDKKHQSND